MPHVNLNMRIENLNMCGYTFFGKKKIFMKELGNECNMRM